MYSRRRARKGQKKLERLGDFLEKALKRKKISIDIMDQDIRNAWRKAVGPQISAQSDPFKFKNGTLYVKVSTPAWMQELQFMKQEIMERLSAAMEKTTFKGIHFSIGHTASPPTDPDTDDAMVTADITLKEREKRLITKTTATITDGELKTIIKRIMKKEMINRKMSGNG
ncbi:MAG: DUF721 domain-containing protein [Deltaproteobacteria bacterium]|nr:DUF721 domain-containing protein [Deltaproteobacteria bacterium]MBN2844601.1 DUF721 domain-containing protein [Deltaproteobacteria bacterium]